MAEFYSLNTNIHYQTWGTEGPRLLLLGGLGDSVRNWQFIAQKLSQHFQVTVMDHRGAGQSSDQNQDFDLNTMVQDTLGLLDHLGWEQSFVLGFSMGGKVAQAVALQAPQKVLGLILVSTSPGWHPDFKPRQDVLDVLNNHQWHEDHFERQFKILYSQNYQKNFPARTFIKYKLNDPFPQSVASYHRQLQALQAFDVHDRLQQLTMPTLVLMGDDDPFCPTAIATAYQKQLPLGEVKIYPGGGHILVADDPQRFMNDITAFIQGHSATTPSP